MDLLALAGPVYQAGTLSGNLVATTGPGSATLRLADDDVYAGWTRLRRPSASWPPRRSSLRASSTVSSMPATCSACSSSIPKYRWWTSTGRAERTRQDSRRSSTRCSPTASTCRPRRSRSGSCRRHTTPPCSNEWPRHCRAGRPGSRSSPDGATVSISTTRIHLLRHGEVLNPDGVLYGRLPGFHLSERGVAMANRIAETVADRDIVRIVSSPLERAQETAHRSRRSSAWTSVPTTG